MRFEGGFIGEIWVFWGGFPSDFVIFRMIFGDEVQTEFIMGPCNLTISTKPTPKERTKILGNNNNNNKNTNNKTTTIKITTTTNKPLS